MRKRVSYFGWVMDDDDDDDGWPEVSKSLFLAFVLVSSLGTVFSMHSAKSHRILKAEISNSLATVDLHLSVARHLLHRTQHQLARTPKR
jgi:hypothetical protein